MRKIFKLNLELQESQTFELPRGSKMMSVGNQGEKLKVWYSDTGLTTKRTFEFKVVGTAFEDGYPNESDGWKFLGTVLFMSGSLVVHVFWRTL